MVDQYLKYLQRKFNLGKKTDLISILRDHEVNTNDILDNGYSILHLLVKDEE